MKHQLTILLLFAALSGYCQHYECLKNGAPNFFVNGNGYLRAIRIDSVDTIGSAIAYFPFHTVRGEYGIGYVLDSNGGSWLGKKVLQLPDGTFLFDNIWNDTVTIKTQASVGDTWTFFRDSTYFSYKAKLVASDTMTVLGVLDSVKKIVIEADTNGVINTRDPVNNFKIILSKHFGFVQVFDLMTFPFHRKTDLSLLNGNFDYYYDLITNSISPSYDSGTSWSFPPDTLNSIFKLINFTVPTTEEIYNFNVGDAFGSIYEFGSGSVAVTKYWVDSIVSKTVTPYTVSYWVYESSRTITTDATFYPPVTTIVSELESFAVYGDTTKLFYWYKLPEEWRSPFFYHYYPDTMELGTPGGCKISVVTIDTENVYYDTPHVRFYQCWDGYFLNVLNVSYGSGYGVTATTKDLYTAYAADLSGSFMYFALKSGTVCGNFPVDVPNPTKSSNSVVLYPNPASTELAVISSDEIKNISITNIYGQTVFAGSDKGNRLIVDISSFMPGIYFLKVNNTEVRKWVKE